MAFFLSRGLFNGEPKTSMLKKIVRWEHSFVFPFDLNNPLMASLFLERMRLHGELLPRKNNVGLPYVYSFTRVGGSGGVMSIYPSYDGHNRKLPVWHYGRLDILPDIYREANVEDMRIDREVLRRDMNTKIQRRQFRPFAKDDKFFVEPRFIDNGLRSNWTGRRDKVTLLLDKEKKKEDERVSDSDKSEDKDILGF